MKNLIVIFISLLILSCTNINKTIKVACIKELSPIVDFNTIKDEICDIVNREELDILFFGEINDNDLEELKMALTGYSFFRNKGENAPEEMKQLNIALLDKQFSTQTQISLALNNVKIKGEPKGGLLALKVRDKKAGITLFIINSAISQSNTNEHIYNIHKIIKSYTDELPVILAGDFSNSEETAKLLTGNWTNMVKLDGEIYAKGDNDNDKNSNQCLYVNGFLSLSKGHPDRRIKNITLSTYAVSFNKNFRDARTHSLPYPLKQPVPAFVQQQIVFSDKLNVEVENNSIASHIVYTTDESTPTLNSLMYNNPINIENTCRIKLRAINKEGDLSSVVCRYFIKSDIKFTVSRVTADPGWQQSIYKDFDFLSDRLKGEESRISNTWLELIPKQTVTIDIKLERETQINKTYISFSKLGKAKIPQIEMIAKDTTGKSIRYQLEPKLLGGYESSCGIEAWLIMDNKIKATELQLQIRYLDSEMTPTYIDEIAFT